MMHANHGWLRRLAAAHCALLALALAAPHEAAAQYAYPYHQANQNQAYQLAAAQPPVSAEPPLIFDSAVAPAGCEAPAYSCQGSCAGGCAACACACPDNTGWYFAFSGGLQHRETVHEASDFSTFLEFADGFGANAALGYRFDMFRVEAEYTFMNNEIDFAGSGGLSSNATGNVNLRALMFNIYHDINVDLWSWQPYVGAGIGIYQSEINSLYPDFFTTLGAPFENVPVQTTSDMPFAFQFRVGATRPIGERTEFYTGYRYFHGTELTFASEPFSNFATTFHPETAYTHSIEFGLRIRF